MMMCIVLLKVYNFHFFTICLAFIIFLQAYQSNVNYFTIFISRFLLETANAMFRLEQFHLVTMISDQITGQDWQGRNLTATESDLEIKSYLIRDRRRVINAHTAD